MSGLLDIHGNALEEAYLTLADDAALPADGAVLVSLARWQADAAAFTSRMAPVAVKLPNTADVLTLDAALLARPLLVLDFPTFADGRAYSQARRLRERCGYVGRLRATGGAVVLDQLVMLLRNGFDEVQLRADQSLTQAADELKRLRDPAYQPDALQSRAVFALRR